ncbi:MAG: DnaD domain protein [Erysipelotrichaceae bacterium]|nr:DnaD domain protein [Erysipelotrichaceae bacterium]MDY5252485.1 DnaD domain protein [Erysipelotrichaceae bacterium]
MKWYKQNYVNRRDWILDNLENLQLSHFEAIVVLLIDFCNVNNIPINLEYLAAKCNCDTAVIDKVISVLCAKNYLDIKAINKSVVFDLSKLFEADMNKQQAENYASIFELFESEFGRPLVADELTKIQEWLKRYDSKLIIYALRQASMYQKVNFAYIQKVLENKDNEC